jgi:hypothetical protein
MKNLNNIIVNKAKELDIPILNYKNIYNTIGDKAFFSHTIVNNPEKLIDILESGKLISSKLSDNSTMTYESDKLIGMDNYVFLALGMGYTKKESYSLIFDAEKLINVSGVNLVKEDLMKIETKFINNFLDEHSEEMVEIILNNNVKLKEIFEKKVKQIFNGKTGIYNKYFGKNAQDVIEDFIKTVNLKGFKKISLEKKVINQFTILTDTILNEKIMPTKLRNELIVLLQKEVVEPNTITTRKSIKAIIDELWKTSSRQLKKFLPKNKSVPNNIIELRIPNELILKDAIIGIYTPNK